MGVVVADAVFQSTLSAKERSGGGYDTETPEYARSCSWQATCDISVVGQKKLVEVEKTSAAYLTGGLVNFFPNKATGDAAQSSAKLVLSTWCGKC